MANALFEVPHAVNEPVRSYAPGTQEREELKTVLKKLKSAEAEITPVINGKHIETGTRIPVHPPHERNHVLGYYHKIDATHVAQAIDAAVKAHHDWERMPWHERAAIFLRAADLLSGPYRAKMNAATMLGQSKTVFQAEIDAVAELADFFRFNVQYATQIYRQQPESAHGIWNRMEYRALEGFVFAITPFNFTSIAGNLPSAPALMGNTVVWKVAETQIYSAQVIMDVFMEAGLPPGVINLMFVDGPVAGDVIFKHPDFTGLHFTGSTGVFQNLWRTIGMNIDKYKTYPRIVGETGGKDFVVAHASADVEALAVALARGAFEYQGQKCSAASRAYVPKSIWPALRDRLVSDVESFGIGSPEDFSNFFNAVIDERSFDKISNYIAKAKQTNGVTVLCGGTCDKTEGYFITPTILQVEDPQYVTMCEEIFGPVLSIYVYDDDKYAEMLNLVDSTSPYALTGAIFARDRAAIALADDVLRQAAGNYYINDKPTGAVVGQQPFGGARASGTNDKAGSVLNLYRWISARTIKENFVPPKEYRYPFQLKG